MALAITAYTYDTGDRLGAGTSTLTTTYDAAGRRTQMQVTGQTAVTYGYDDAHRITGITQGTNVVGFTYDAASRRSGVGPTQPLDVHAESSPRSRIIGVDWSECSFVDRAQNHMRQQHLSGGNSVQCCTVSGPRHTACTEAQV